VEAFFANYQEFFIQHENLFYLGLLVATFLEGETIVIIAGYLAAAGYFSLPMIILSAFTGTMCGDQLYFYIGRLWGKDILQKRSRLTRARVIRVTRLLRRYDVWFILSFRFIYGVRNVTPFAIGLSTIPALRFFILNFIAAAVWAVTFGSVGYFFGQAVKQFLSEYDHYILPGMIGLAVLVWLGYKAWGYVKARRLQETDETHEAQGTGAP
jgi:membrane protein DedA with SNARE-associated domain